ncbi:MAG TPA: 30S ribosomal protein S20 [Chthoniobacterales bacterium]|nr:30S ribosomal protein S20 [Chthoniobacterales bacterium]
MANTRSAAKRARQTGARSLQNKSVLTGIKSQQRKLSAAMAGGDKSKIEAELTVFASRLDKAAKRGVVHKNYAARRKSRATHAAAAKLKA